jgi:hypothetical protein
MLKHTYIHQSRYAFREKFKDCLHSYCYSYKIGGMSGPQETTASPSTKLAAALTATTAALTAATAAVTTAVTSRHPPPPGKNLAHVDLAHSVSSGDFRPWDIMTKVRYFLRTLEVPQDLKTCQRP